MDTLVMATSAKVFWYFSRYYRFCDMAVFVLLKSDLFLRGNELFVFNIGLRMHDNLREGDVFFKCIISSLDLLLSPLQ